MADTRHSKGRLPLLVLRADADARIGTGHLMRSLALGQAYQAEGGSVKFVTACKNRRLLKRLREENFKVDELESPYPDPLDWRRTEVQLAEDPDSWLILDGYNFEPRYQLLVKQSDHRLMVIDDLADLPHYYSDIILNQNIRATDLIYPCEPDTKLLLGTKYVILRKEFLSWRDWKRTIPELGRKVLVTMGGGDPDNVTLKVIDALPQVGIEGLEATVLVGETNLHLEELENAVRSSPISIHLEHNVNSMPEKMRWADVAVAAGGTTTWELAFLGTPRLVVALAPNQEPVATALNELGAAINLGTYDSVTSSQIAHALRRLLEGATERQEMSHRARGLIDGEGADRVLMQLKGDKIRLRRVREDDCRMLWECVNEGEARSSAFSTEPIAWDDHQEWFAKKLADRKCFSFVGVDVEDNPVGFLRFDMSQGDEAEVDINVRRSERGKGYGTLLLSAGADELLRISVVRAFHAFIKPQNSASIGVFERCQFKNLGPVKVKGNSALHFIRDRNDRC